jgi:hypothetical protein
VAQGEGPEFKLQYHPKNKSKERKMTAALACCLRAQEPAGD